MYPVFAGLSWMAIVIATLAYYLLGALWFTPLFGTMYDRALGFERVKGHRWSPIYYVGPGVSSFVVTLATSILINALEIAVFSEALVLGLIVGVGYSVPISFNNAINPKTPMPLLYGAVTGAYHVTGALLVAAILFVLS